MKGEGRKALSQRSSRTGTRGTVMPIHCNVKRRNAFFPALQWWRTFEAVSPKEKGIKNLTFYTMMMETRLQRDQHVISRHVSALISNYTKLITYESKSKLEKNEIILPHYQHRVTLDKHKAKQIIKN